MSQCHPKPDILPDERQRELILAAREGCKDSFDTLSEQYWPRLFRFLHQRTANRQDAEDLVQETLMRCFQHLGQYDIRKSFTTWLFTIASRLAVNHHRKLSPRIHSSLPEIICENNRPHSAMEQQEDAEGLWLAVRQLPQNQAVAVELHYLGEMSIRQVAEVMGLTIIHVRVLLYRARRTLIQTAGQLRPEAKKSIIIETIKLRKAQV